MEKEMIKSLKIQNFQSHEKTELNFNNGVNVIVGSSDAGKSSIIRAIRWLVWNRPSGDSIRSTWGGRTVVQLETEEGVVARSKDKIDSYELTEPAGRPVSFKAIGTGVPDDIVRALNIRDVNLQQQLDSPFLLSDSAGEVAAYFNKMARLDQIDTGTQNVNAQIRELTADIKYKSADAETLEKKLAEFIDLDKFEAEVEDLENAERDLIALVNGRRRLTKLVEDIKRVEEMQEEFAAIIVVEPLVTAILVNYSQKRMFQDERNTLQRLVDSIGTMEQRQLTAQENAVELEEQFHRDMPDVCPLCGNKIKK
jgi:DNA repair protein SbcC/Rad50